MHPTNQVKFFTGRNTRYLAEDIAKSFGIELGKTSVTEFSDGEFQPCFDESVRGSTVFIIQSTFQPTDNLFELLLMIDAARRASAYKIVAVIPYFGWARQDRKDKPRVSIGAKLVANLLCASGVDRVLTMDLHADQIQGFFEIPVDHIYSSSLFLPHIKKLNLENLSIAAPDMGGAKRANAYSKILNAPMIICHKSRDRANEVASMTAIGDVEGRNIVVLDDMIDTAGTVAKISDMMMEKGALSVRVYAAHPILSGKAYERIAKSSLVEVVVTDTIPLREDVDKSKISVISTAPLFADIINKIYNCNAISSTFVM